MGNNNQLFKPTNMALQRRVLTKNQQKWAKKKEMCIRDRCTVVPRQSQIRTLHLQLPFVDRDRQQIVRTHGTCAGDDDQSR